MLLNAWIMRSFQKEAKEKQNPKTVLSVKGMEYVQEDFIVFFVFREKAFIILKNRMDIEVDPLDYQPLSQLWWFHWEDEQHMQ